MKIFRLCLLFSMLFSATFLSAQPEVFLPDQAQVQQQIQFQQQSIQSADVLSNRDRLSDVSLANSSDNPEFVTHQQTDKRLSLSTVKTLVPYEDLYKVLQKDIGKYFIIPITEFEALKQAKEAWLASKTAPVEAAPLLHNINSARLEGRLEDNFAYITANFRIETFTDEWHDVPLLWGSLAVEEVKLNGNSTSLKISWLDKNTRQVNFGRLSKQHILQNALQARGNSDTLSQDNWKDTLFMLPIKGKGIHETAISFVVPVQNIDDLYTLQFNMARIPLTFMRFNADRFVLSVDQTSFKDYSIKEIENGEKGCEFIGWLGANSEVLLKWRRKSIRSAVKTSPAETTAATADTATTTEKLKVEPETVKPVIQPLLYARSHTLVSLGETSIQAYKTFDFSISKAPVSAFTFHVPENTEIVFVNADRQMSHRMLREAGQKRLRVEFHAGREDTAQIEIGYEAGIDLTSSITGIPEVYPLNIERELGAVAIEALTSVEVQPGNSDNHPLNKGVYPLDPLEIPQPLKDRAIRPVLLAYHQNTYPSNILLSVKRYQDVAQQTVVADSMEVKTTFTTNKTSNTLISMNIRNNNKQYLQLQLASGSEVVSAFRGGLPVKLVAGKNDGKVQIPLDMSQTVGEPLEMNLQINLKQPVDEVQWRGRMNFAPPLVDIPVSRFSWYIYAPEDYHLFDFLGTVKDTSPTRDPFFFRGFLNMLKFAWGIITDPDAVFTIVFFGFLILLIASRTLLMKILKFIWDVISGIFSFIFSGARFRLIELMIVLGIIAVLAAISVPNFRKSREQSRHKACFANQRVIAGAVEMYNMDHDQPMTSLNLDLLVKKGYLKARPTLPEPGCHYMGSGNLSQTGQIYCRLHGNVDGSVPEAPTARMADMAMEKKMSVQHTMESSSAAKKGKHEGMKADSHMPTPADSFGSVKAKGMRPIKTKFSMTRNYYRLERDLVIADLASDGAILANSTSPSVNFSYVHMNAIKTAEIIAFIMALFAGLYFVSGAFLGYNGKVMFAALIIIFLSIFDMKLKTIGNSANAGLWVALAGAFIWKAIWLLSHIKFNSDGNEAPPERGVAADLSEKAGRSSLLILLLISLAVTFVLPAAAFAQSREIRVMAPFKELEKVIPSGDRVVIIPEEDYRYLKDIVEPVKPEISAPQAFRFESIFYRGTVEERGVRFKGDFKVSLFNSGWKKIGLLSPDAIPSYATMNGEALPITMLNQNGIYSYGFLTNATGTANISVDFFIPLSSSEYRHTSRFTLNTTAVSLARLEITVNEKDCEAWIDPGVLKPAIRQADKTVFSATLPPTSAVNFELYRNAQIIKPDVPEPETGEPSDKPEPEIIEEKTRVTAQQLNLIYFKEGFVSGINTYDLQIKGGAGIASISFQVPERLRILKVENRLVEDWKIKDTANEKILEVTFKSNIRGNTSLMVEFEEDIQNLKDEAYFIPELIPLDVEKSIGVLGIGCLQTLEINVSAPQGFSPVVAAEFLKDWNRERPEKTPYAFKFLRHPNQLEVAISRPEDISQQTAVIDRAEAMTLLNEEGYILTRVVYEVRNNSQQFLKLKLPQSTDHPTELWSTQVAGSSVRAGYDEENKVYNLPIIRSPIERGESKSFSVELVYSIKTGKLLQAFNRAFLELPAAHLPISELSWIVYLPDGYELMRETGNVDRNVKTGEIKFLDNESYFTQISSVKNVQRRQQQSFNQMVGKQSERVFGITGLMPVKFKIPTTSWSTFFTMLQIEPEGKAPYIDAMVVNPRKGKGHAFQIFMILVGMLTGLCLIRLVTSDRRYFWFLILAVQGSILAVAVYLKLYQADHFYQMGLSTILIVYILFHFFRFKPAESEKASSE